MPMKKVSVTYVAPAGDAKVTEMFGHTLYDGKAEDIEVTERELEKLKGNPCFKVGKEADADDAKVDPKAAQAEQEAAQRADDSKREAQGYSPPLRGAQSNPPPTEAEQAAAAEAAAKEAKGGAGDPQHKKDAAREHGSQGPGTQAGRDK
jgi:hypothetical protein